MELISLEDNSYHIAIKVEVNDIKGEMLIDTGASVSIIDKDHFPELEIVNMENNIESGGVNGEVEAVNIVKVDKFNIYEAEINDYYFASMSLSYVNKMYGKLLNRNILGLIGSDFCVEHNVSIDYSRMIFKLKLTE